MLKDEEGFDIFNFADLEPYLYTIDGAPVLRIEYSDGKIVIEYG